MFQSIKSTTKESYNIFAKYALKMSNSLQEQRRLIEEKKRQVLERTSVKKDSEKLNAGTSTQAAGPSPVLLVNDGNFLARFQAMQKECAVKKESTKKDESNSGKLTINLGGAKKKEVKPIASNLPRPTAFEVPEDETEETGKLAFLLAHQPCCVNGHKKPG